MSVVVSENRAFPISIPVVVIGGGACGSVAALAAKEMGAEVVVFERDAVARGNTALSSGQIPAAGTRLQRAAGIDDSWEILAADLIAKTRGQTDLGMARRIARESGPTIDWLVDRHGLKLSCVTDFAYPGNSRPHMHGTLRRSGADLMAALTQALADNEIPSVASAHVVDLYVDKEGKISGIAYVRPNGVREEVGCGAVILACNGFGANRALVRKYIPAMAEAHHHGHEGNDGSAVIWGEALGASLKDMGSFQGHSALCIPHMIHLGWPAFSQGGFQVNAEGRRFSNETEGVSEQALKVLRQPGAVAWAVWDARCDAVADQMHNHLEAKKAGAVRSFADLSDAAAFVGCDPDQLIETVRSVERFAHGEQRCPWGRDFTRFPPLRPPYLMAKITGALFHTQGGLEVDLEARVRRQDGSQFPNLLAGGGAARGLVGPADWGYLPGAGLLSAINLGRIAGESAAALVAGCPGPRP
jgi:fumarate reductase flavoprotein subunit